MCGIAGFVAASVNYPEQVVKNMTDAVLHRGPDDDGCWCDREIGVALGHRRLAVIDRSAAGHQPMVSVSGRYVLTFNGEIYNRNPLREELEQIARRQWRGRSDTEVMLEGFETWGIPKTIERLVGMFAIALWDRDRHVLYLMRDRLGEKPLYYGRVGRAFVFASELKSLRRFPEWGGKINRSALTMYLRHNCIPAPHSIYDGIYKLLPGTFLSLAVAAGDGGPGKAHTEVYWSAAKAAESGLAHPFVGSEQEAVQQLDQLLRAAICQQMEADVPLGVFLSGGVDSSTIAALMQAQSQRSVRTFTIGFREKGYNEADDARSVAQHLGTDHTECYLEPADALTVIPSLPVIFDEPFSDSSQIPTYLLSKVTGEKVTVALSGDAADELFGGYNRYAVGRDVWRKVGWLPPPIRRAFSQGVLALSPRCYDAFVGACCFMLPKRLRQRSPGDQLHKLARILDVRDPLEMYGRLTSQWQAPADVVVDGAEPPTSPDGHALPPGLDDFTLQMMYRDLVGYLPDDILVKVDRAAMACSLETRVPFLDHRVVEFAWRIPLGMKLRAGRGKWLLRQVLYRYVPAQIVDRPKAGFAVPIHTWLRGPLRDWAESLLDPASLNSGGLFHPQPVLQKWHEHLSGRRNWQHHLWTILMAQAWLKNVRS